MIRSSFASFGTAQRAISANQNAISVAGQNIANVNTEGYTRQKLDQVSLNLTNTTCLYEKIPDAHIGYGVNVVSVSQIRDPFLDARYRRELGNVGKEDNRLTVLNNLADVIDETTNDGLILQINDLADQLENLAGGVGDETLDNLVRASAQNFATLLNNYSTKISDVRKQLEEDVQIHTDEVNNILSKIEELNVNIKKSQVHGNSALELQDERNRCIDELATYMEIKVTHETDTTMSGADVDVCKIDFITDDGKAISLINDTKAAAKFSLVEISNGKFQLDVTDSTGTKTEGISSSKGSFISNLAMLNDSGEFDSPPNTSRGIGFYENMLDTLASKFADTLNKLNTVTKKDADGNDLYSQHKQNASGDLLYLDADGNETTTVTGTPAMEETATPRPDADAELVYLEKSGALFATLDGSDKITAANITISSEWNTGEVRIIASQVTGAASNDNSNINNMIAALTNEHSFDTKGDGSGESLYSGSFQGFLENTTSILATDQEATETRLNNYLATANEISDSKDSVSGVNLDEETVNIMQYNNALNAASRFMTTLDEELNTIINSMGVVGR